MNAFQTPRACPQARAMLTVLAAVAMLASLTALPALAADTDAPGAEAGPDMAAMMEAMAEANAPGEHHRFLASMAGEWTFESTVWMDPEAPPMKSTGTSSKKMVFGDRYLQEDVTGDMMGTTFRGRGVTGFDNATGEFVGTWIDDMSTGMAIVRGTRRGSTLQVGGEMVDPMSRQPMKMRYVTRVESPDRHVFEYYMTMPGAAEVKSMEIVYTRKGSG